MRKALGRCRDKHVQVVEYLPPSEPKGVCKFLIGEKACGLPLTQWAVKYPTAPAA